MDKKEIEQQIEILKRTMKRLDDAARGEGRGLNEAEANLKKEMADEIDRLMHPPEERMVGGRLWSPTLQYQRASGEGYELRGPGQDKSWASLFGNRGGYEWEDKQTNFLSAAFSGRFHPGLTTRSMSETIPSDGGFLIAGETAGRIHAVSLENEIVQPRCYVQPMISNSIKIPAMSIGSHGTNLFGGFTAGYTAEAGTIDEHSPKARSMELNAKKLTGLIRFTSELSADTPGGMAQIETLIGKGLGWYRDRAFLKGTGAGQPLGILNASCVVIVAKETGQKKIS